MNKDSWTGRRGTERRLTQRYVCHHEGGIIVLVSVIHVLMIQILGTCRGSNIMYMYPNSHQIVMYCTFPSSLPPSSSLFLPPPPSLLLPPPPLSPHSSFPTPSLLPLPPPPSPSRLLNNGSQGKDARPKTGDILLKKRMTERKKWREKRSAWLNFLKTMMTKEMTTDSIGLLINNCVSCTCMHRVISNYM